MKILVIQTAFLGDAILTLPMIQVLNKQHPNSFIDVVAIPSTRIIFEASPYVRKVFVLDKKKRHKSIFSLIKFSKTIRRENYDKIISPHRSARSSLMVLFSRVRETTGFNNAALKFVYKNLVEYKRSHHEVERNLNLIGFNTKNNDWKIRPIVKDIEGKIDDALGVFPAGRVVALAPGSVWETKKYPKEYFIEIIDRLIYEKIEVILIGGEEDTSLCKKIKDSASGKITDLCGKLSVIESIHLLKKCTLLISNDSAPTHMGVAAGIPVVTLFCSTVPGFGFYPYGENDISLSYNDLDCKPCGIHGFQKCPVETFDCGLRLKPAEVINSVAEIIE